MRIYCRGKKVKGGSLDGIGCKCTDANCFYCVLQHESQGGEFCKICKNGLFLLDNKCIETCPTTHVAEDRKSLYGRDCFLAPTMSPMSSSLSPTVYPTSTPSLSRSYSCTGGIVSDEITQTCSCTDIACVSCDKSNVADDVCTECSNSKYELSGICVDDCGDSFALGHDPSGRFCRPDGYKCIGGTVVHRSRARTNICSCPVNLGECIICSFEGTLSRPVVSCETCQNDQVLFGGMCLVACPSNTTQVNGSNTGIGHQCVP